MLNKVLLTLATAGMMILSAAGVSYKVSLLDDSVVAGKQIKAGDYKVELKDNNTAVLMHGKKSIEVPAKAETSPTKFATTEIQYSNNNQLQEIRVGGTNTKIVFGDASTPASGM
ncbi:MAG TPA: hypothetical protein VFA65_07135 [Bryobacteraceae bacterium]|nr:hypothetical protein [Bryobacteraceae bacterium]